jgi:hypothetical protein
MKKVVVEFTEKEAELVSDSLEDTSGRLDMGIQKETHPVRELMIDNKNYMDSARAKVQKVLKGTQ